jgi:hypothetical protein
MPYPKKYWSLDSKEDIVRGRSSAELERLDYFTQKKRNGCELCGFTFRLAFHHTDPSSKTFDVQSAGLRTSESDLDAEIAKCVCICVSCRQKIKGGKRPTSRVKNKQLFWDLQKIWYTPPEPLPTKKRSIRKQTKNL